MSSWCHNTLSDARREKRDGKERFIDILTLKCSPQRLGKLTWKSFGCLAFGDRHRLPAECDLEINLKSFFSIIHDDKCAPKGGKNGRIVYGQQVVGAHIAPSWMITKHRHPLSELAAGHPPWNKNLFSRHLHTTAQQATTQKTSAFSCKRRNCLFTSSAKAKAL